MNININHIKFSSYVDGPGRRTVLFVQGCTLACPGCQNRALWDFNGGMVVDTRDVANALAFCAAEHGNVTISGGEPFAQPQALAHLVRDLREAGIRDILVYSGYTWEQLTAPTPALIWVMEVMRRIDTLVDGPFIRERDDGFITWRGSRNQRPIDVQATLRAGEVITHDWDKPEIVITGEGEALMPIALAEYFRGMGRVTDTRRCGQTN